MERIEQNKNKINADNQFVVTPMLLRTLEAGGFLRANGSFLAKVGFSEAELVEKPFLYWIDPNDVKIATATIEGEQSSCQIAHRTKDGGCLPFQIRAVEDGGESLVLLRFWEDAELIDGPEDFKDEATVSGTLDTIARIVELQNPGYKCSILLVADGRFVRGAGPSLPEDYNAAIDGYAVGPTVGSCGTAIYWNVPVIVEDIQADPLWVPFAELAKKAGVAACWSHPFSSTTGNVLGALALYSPVPRTPTKEQLILLKAVARMTGLAVERGRAEEALRVQHKRELELEGQLHQANKIEDIGTLAGGIAHDFNNILAGILGYAELAITQIEENNNTKLKDKLDKIILGSIRARDLVQQILQFSRKGDRTVTPVRLYTIIEEALKFLRSSLPSTIEMETDIDPDIQALVNPTEFHQVIMNLCTNAFYAMRTSGGLLTVKLTNIQTSRNSENVKLLIPNLQYLELSVEDTGQGIPAEAFKRIFEPYYTSKQFGEGTGLGLAVVHGLVKGAGGEIFVKSTLNMGTCFKVYLPTTEARTPTAISSNEGKDPSGGNERIVIVDDDENLIEMNRHILEDLGYKTLPFSNSSYALDYILNNQSKIDLIITDMTMPKITGLELFKQVNKVAPDIPVILYSGYSDLINREEALSIGFSDYLQKPVSMQDLTMTIRKSLDESHKG